MLAKALKRVRNTAALERDKPKAERAAIEILEPEEAKAALAALQGHYLWPIAFLALHTGMRRGELLGLQWADVGLDKAEIRVTRSLEQTKAGLRLKAPKTASGSRTIAIDADVVDMLRKHKLETQQQRMACGGAGS